VDEDAQIRDLQSRMSYVLGLIAVCLLGVFAFVVVQAWFWAAFSLVGVFFGANQLRIFRRKLERIQAGVEPRDR